MIQQQDVADTAEFGLVLYKSEEQTMSFRNWVNESVFHDLPNWKQRRSNSKIPKLKPHQQLQAQEGKKKQI